MKGSTHTRKELDTQPVIRGGIKIYVASQAFSRPVQFPCPACWLLPSQLRCAKISLTVTLVADVLRSTAPYLHRVADRLHMHIQALLCHIA